jgi:hypothetical protein
MTIVKILDVDEDKVGRQSRDELGYLSHVGCLANNLDTVFFFDQHSQSGAKN